MRYQNYNKKRSKASRIHSGNTITALKYIRKLDEIERKKYGTKNIESSQQTEMVGIDTDRSECEEGESVFEKDRKSNK